MTLTDVEFLGNSRVANFGYDTIKDIVARDTGHKNNRNTVNYLEVLNINAHQQYLKDFLVVVSTQVAGKSRVLSVQYRKTPIFLNIRNQLRKVLKEMIAPPIQTESITEIKEWMR